MVLVSQLKDQGECNRMLLKDLLRQRPLENFGQVFTASLQ